MPNTELLQQISLILAPIQVVIAVIGAIINYIRSRRTIEKVPTDSPKILRITRLVQSTTESSWELLRDISIFLNILILGYDVALVVGLVGALVVEGNNLFDIRMIVILIVLFVFPISILRDEYEVEVRLRRGEGSKVFKFAEIEVTADYDSLLFRCLQVLSDIGARTTNYDAVKGVMVAELPNSEVKIKITPLKGDQYIVYVSSDSKRPTVKVDFGVNQKYVNECTTRLLGLK